MVSLLTSAPKTSPKCAGDLAGGQALAVSEMTIWSLIVEAAAALKRSRCMAIRCASAQRYGPKGR